MGSVNTLNPFYGSHTARKSDRLFIIYFQESFKSNREETEQICHISFSFFLPIHSYSSHCGKNYISITLQTPEWTKQDFHTHAVQVSLRGKHVT